MSTRINGTFRPFRFLYLVVLVLVAAFHSGALAAVLVGLAAMDLELQ